MEPDSYCREIEAYLCRKNDGHLVRIVGPSFERVREWADRGVPLTIVFRGIDRHFERYYARGPRRRPVRVDFCEADVLDVFDEWRRAVGVRAAELAGDAGGRDDDREEQPVRRTVTLPVHLDRTIARLTAMRAGPAAVRLDGVLERLVRELDALRHDARHARGDARQAILKRLNSLDRDLVRGVREATPPDAIAELERQAADELVAYRPRMSEDAYKRAMEASVDRLLRQRAGVPLITLA